MVEQASEPLPVKKTIKNVKTFCHQISVWWQFYAAAGYCSSFSIGDRYVEHRKNI